MASSQQRQIRSLGKGHDFVLYMFKDDIEMFREFEHDSSGKLMGLWTSTGNPVVHIVDRETYREGKFPGPYKALQSFKDLEKIVTTVGYWYFNSYNGVPDTTKDQKPFVHLRIVTEDYNTFNFDPVLCQGRNIPVVQGRIERLSEKNPFRLNSEDAGHRSENKKIGRVKQCKDFFESTRQQVSQFFNASSDKDTKESKQWYGDQGAQTFLQNITELLEKETGNAVEIKRDEETYDMFLKFLLDNNELALAFPSNFPDRPATLYKRQEDNSVKEISNIPCHDRDPNNFMESLLYALR